MQDFSQKMTLVIREGLASWQLTNTIGHIAAYLGNKMQAPFDTGEYFATQDQVNLPRNSQFPLVVLSATSQQLKELAEKIRRTNLLWIVYVQDMIDLIDDEELVRALAAKASGEIDILGIGLFGAKDDLKQLTGTLRLWK